MTSDPITARGTLEAVGPFRELGDELLDRLEGSLEERRLDEGDYVFRSGEPSNALYLIQAGSVALLTEETGKALRLVDRLERGALFGEVGVLDDSLRAASARALESTRLLTLGRDEVRRLVRESRDFGVALVLFAMEQRRAGTAAAAELGDRGDPRVRVDRTVYLWPEGGTAPIPVKLENLSVGGAGFDGVPDEWRQGAEVAFSIEIDPANELLRTRGRVVWRRGAAAGIAFEGVDERHRERIRRALNRLLAPEE